MTLVLVALNLVVFAWQLTLDGDKDPGGISERDVKSVKYGPQPVALSHFETPDDAGTEEAPWPVTIVTGMFMHGGIWALLCSVVFLWVFGPAVEGAFGRLGFTAFYLLAGIVAAYGQTLLDPDSAVPFISAAGAVGGVIAAHLVLFRGARIVWIVFIPFMMGTVEIAAGITALVWLGLQLLPGVGGVATPDIGPQVIYLAPVAGILFGLLVGGGLQRRVAPVPA